MQPVRTDDSRQILDLLASRPEVAEAVTLPAADSSDRPLVVVVPQDFLTGFDVWRILVEALGVPPDIGAIAIAPKLCRRPDGALDEDRMREYLSRSASTYRFAPPAGETERRLAAIWQRVLGTAEIGALDDFVEAGGDSMAAVEVIAAIEAEFGGELSLEQLFQAGSVRALAGLLGAREAGTTHDATRFPLSLNQQFLCMFDAGGASGPFGPRYHLVFGRRLTGPLDLATLRGALVDVVDRHEALRTTIVRSGPSRYQQVFDARPPGLEVRECPGVPVAERAQRVEEFLEEIEAGEIDAEQVPHLRAVLLRFDEQDAVLALMTHHAASDGWSMHVLTRDLAACYAGRVSGGHPDLPTARPYREFVAWELAHVTPESTAGAVRHWTEALRGARLCALAADHPRSADLPRVTGLYRFTIEPELAAGVQRLVQAERCSAFMVLLAAYVRLLHRITGGTDIVVPTNTAGRAQGRFDDTVGSFFNFLPLRIDLAGCRDVPDLLRRTRDACFAAFDNDIPAVRIFAAAPDLMAPAMQDDLAPVTFQALPAAAALQSTDAGGLRWSEIRRRLATVPVTSDIPDGALWTVHFDPPDEAVVILNYRRNRFDESTIIRLAGRYQEALRDLVAGRL